MGAETRDALIFWNALSNFSDHMNSFLVQSSGLSRENRLVMVEVEVTTG